MADFHFHGKVISRSKGRSAVGAAAYRSGEKLTNEKDGVTHDYTKKGGVVYSEIMLCENAPTEYKDRATLWNAVESTATANERLARDFDIALPLELSRGEQIDLVRNYVNDNFVKAGMCADFAIHDKGDGNPHAHIMLTMRPIDETGKWEYVSQKLYICKDHEGNTAELSASELKKAQIDGKTFEKQLPYFKNGKGKATYLTKYEAENDKKYKDYIRVKGKNDPLKTKEDRRNPIIEKWDSNESFNKWRENWAAYQNREFEKKNLSVRVDHRSYEKQGIDKIPTKHLGVSAKAMEERGNTSKRGNENREIKVANIQVDTLKIQQQYIQKEIACVREDISWKKHHEEIAKIEAKIPQIAGNEKTLLAVQTGLLKLYENAKLLNPSKISEGRTVEYDGRQVPYFDYHKNKLISEISFAQEKIKNHLQTIKEKEQLAKLERPRAADQPQEKGGFAARRETLMKQEAPQEQPKIDTAYAEKMARELVSLRNEFVRETMRSEERTSYQPNLIHGRQANEIESLSRTISDQSRSIAVLTAERDKLGLLKVREKKEIQGKIDNFESLRRGNIEKLKALGVPDPSKADEVIKEKRTLAAAEQSKAQAAKLNEGAKGRAEEAKAVFLEVAKSIPADQRQAVLDRMEQYKERPEAGRLQYFKAEAEARRQLDAALKPDPQERQRNKIHEKGRGQEI